MKPSNPKPSSIDPRSAPVSYLTAWIDRRLNPVVFKEYALFMRSRSMVGLYCAAGALPLVFVCFVLGVSLAENWATPGLYVWSWSFGVLLTIGCGGLATLAMRSVTIEREAGTYDLLAASPLEPSALVWGKWQASMVFAVFAIAAFLPFAAAAYLLGGVDLLGILVSLLVGTMAFGLSTAAGICSALYGKSGVAQAARLSFIGIAFAFGGGLLSAMLAAMHEALMRGSFFTGASVPAWKIIVGFVVGSLSLWFVAVYFTITSAAARITLPGLNPQGIRRRATFRCVGIILLCTVAVTALAPTEEGMIIAMLVVLALFKIFFTWETVIDTAVPGRLTHRIARNWRSPMLLPGRPFAYRSLFWLLVMIDGLGAALLFLAYNSTFVAHLFGLPVPSAFAPERGPFIAFGVLTQISLYLLIYSLVVDRVCRRFPTAKPAVLLVLLIAAGSILSSLYLVICHHDDQHFFDPFYLVNPVWWLYFMDRPETLLDGLQIAQLLWVIPGIHLLYQWRAYHSAKEQVQKLCEDETQSTVLEL